MAKMDIVVLDRALQVRSHCLEDYQESKKALDAAEEAVDQAMEELRASWAKEFSEAVGGCKRNLIALADTLHEALDEPTIEHATVRIVMGELRAISAMLAKALGEKEEPENWIDAELSALPKAKIPVRSIDDIIADEFISIGKFDVVEYQTNSDILWKNIGNANIYGFNYAVMQTLVNREWKNFLCRNETKEFTFGYIGNPKSNIGMTDIRTPADLAGQQYVCVCTFIMGGYVKVELFRRSDTKVVPTNTTMDSIDTQSAVAGLVKVSEGAMVDLYRNLSEFMGWWDRSVVPNIREKCIRSIEATYGRIAPYTSIGETILTYAKEPRPGNPLVQFTIGYDVVEQKVCKIQPESPTSKFEYVFQVYLVDEELHLYIYQNKNRCGGDAQ